MATSISPSYVQQLSGVEDIHGFVTRVCFKTGPPGAVGMESEWFVSDPLDRDRPVPIRETRSLLDRARLPRRSVVTYEPGGQIELSTVAAPSLSRACDNLAVD